MDIPRSAPRSSLPSASVSSGKPSCSLGRSNAGGASQTLTLTRSTTKTQVRTLPGIPHATLALLAAALIPSLRARASLTRATTRPLRLETIFTPSPPSRTCSPLLVTMVLAQAPMQTGSTKSVDETITKTSILIRTLLVRVFLIIFRHFFSFLPISPHPSPPPLGKFNPSPARLAELTAGFPTPPASNGPPALITTGRMTKTHADPLIAQRTYLVSAWPAYLTASYTHQSLTLTEPPSVQ